MGRQTVDNRLLMGCSPAIPLSPARVRERRPFTAVSGDLNRMQLGQGAR
jgi:hypothetical protein